MPNTSDHQPAMLRMLEGMEPGEIESFVNADLRHGSHTPRDYLKHFLTFSRLFAYATHDDSWGELEKEFNIMVRRLIVAERALKVPEVWSKVERDGMAAAFAKASEKHGHYESMFAAAAWLLRHRSGEGDE